MDQKEFVKKVRERFDQGGREVMAHKDGTVTVKCSYYYAHGGTASSWGEKVLKAIPEAEVVEHGDHWAPWPKPTYWWVKIRLKVAEVV